MTAAGHPFVILRSECADGLLVFDGTDLLTQLLHLDPQPFDLFHQFTQNIVDAIVMVRFVACMMGSVIVVTVTMFVMFTMGKLLDFVFHMRVATRLQIMLDGIGLTLNMFRHFMQLSFVQMVYRGTHVFQPLMNSTARMMRATCVTLDILVEST